MGLQKAVNGVTFHCFFYARIYGYNGESLHESGLFLIFFAPLCPCSISYLWLYARKQPPMDVIEDCAPEARLLAS